MHNPMRHNRSLQWLALVGLATAWLTTGPGRGPQDEPLTLAQSLSEAYQQLARDIGPAVVQVTAYRKVGSRRRRLQDGSGVIIRQDGLVVTNNHVVDNAEIVSVALTDGRRLDATVVGTDQDSDLAVLRVDGEELTWLPLCKNPQPDPGQLVLAIGNPLGLGHSVTAGIVSGVGRSDLNIAFYEDFIQTDAQINAGNSGGPLVNLEGEIIGINTAVAITADDNGIAFAIPSRMVRRTVDDILEFGEVRRGFLGVENLSYFRAARFLEQARSTGGASRVEVERRDPGNRRTPHNRSAQLPLGDCRRAARAHDDREGLARRGHADAPGDHGPARLSHDQPPGTSTHELKRAKP